MSMINKVRVHGKAQNRTVLGIVNAYLVMNPKSTLAELKEAFPDSLNPDSGVKINFVDINHIKEVQPEKWNGFFTREDELLHLADGTTAALVSMWTKPSFERIVERAAKFGIEIASFEKTEKGFGNKGGYSLEYLNGYVPPVVAEESKSKLWMWILIIAAIIILGLLGFFLLGNKNSAPEAVKTKIVTDTVTIIKYEKQIDSVEKDFNAAKFALDKAELNDSAKMVLNKLADIMNSHKDLKVEIVGHTSNEGSVEHNQKLSEQRAKAAYDYLVGRGVNSSQLKYEGKGSSEPIDENKPELNRRTEFNVK